MSPEQVRGGRATPRSDVYALGVVLWEVLAGAPPPRGEVPAGWKDFLARALDPDAERRFADAAEAARALPSSPLADEAAPKRPLGGRDARERPHADGGGGPS